MEILDLCMNEYAKLSMKVFKLNPLHDESLPGYGFDGWLMSSGTILEKLKEKQKLDDFIEAKRGGMCGMKGNRLFNTRKSNNTILHIDANKLYGNAMMQKLPCKDLKYTTTSLDDISNTPNDSNCFLYSFWYWLKLWLKR